jgi:predicted nuclease with TOPRIM domain
MAEPFLTSRERIERLEAENARLVERHEQDKLALERAAGRLEILTSENDRLREALEPFTHLAAVMQEGQYLNHMGVYVSWADAWMAFEILRGADHD